jgi:hypothetical protein
LLYGVQDLRDVGHYDEIPPEARRPRAVLGRRHGS